MIVCFVLSSVSFYVKKKTARGWKECTLLTSLPMEQWIFNVHNNQHIAYLFKLQKSEYQYYIEVAKLE
jgi:hypothetical protein